MKTLVTSVLAALTLAGCAVYPVYEQPVYYRPARIVYSEPVRIAHGYGEFRWHEHDRR